MTYAVKSIILTVQGEGCNAGSLAVFVRFTGCNAWTGNPVYRERDNARTGAACALWCDTDFTATGAARLAAPELAAAIRKVWGAAAGLPLVVFTGGEPLLQLDSELVDALGLMVVAVETNGSVAPRPELKLDHITVSPKHGLPLDPEFVAWARAHPTGCELKVVLPGAAVAKAGWMDVTATTGWTDAELLDLRERLRPSACYVQPQDPVNPHTIGVTHLTSPRGTTSPRGVAYAAHVQRCMDFVTRHSGWRVSAQTHKVLGVP